MRNGRCAPSNPHPASPANGPTAPPANNAAPARTPETASPTNPARHERTTRGQAQARSSRGGQATRAHATSLRTGAPASARRRHEHRSRCRSLRPYRIFHAVVSSSPVRVRRGRAPCIAKTEWARCAGCLRRCVGATAAPTARSQLALALPLLILPQVLRRADEHLDDVVLQAIEDVPLQHPLELRIVKIARMHLKVVSVHRRLRESWADADFD